MDKSWMHARKWSSQYVEGVKSFMKFVEEKLGSHCDIQCPCIDCLNVYKKNQGQVYEHLLLRGIDTFYTIWIHHGEPSNYTYGRHGGENENDFDASDMSYNDREEDDGINDMLDDFGNFINNLESTTDNGVFVNHIITEDAFGKLLKEAQQRLYPECSQFSQLSFIVKLLHLKVYNKWGNKLFDMLLELLKVALPEANTLPRSYYDAKNLLRDLGLGYTSIHACKYDCTLYWKDTADREDCLICGTTRWKINDGKGKKIPHKVLRYFPVIPRLQRLFMSKKTATDMRWHKEKRVNNDTIMQHPADSKAWKHLDEEFPWFAEDYRNVRLGLAIDGFNPFGNISKWIIVGIGLRQPNLVSGPNI
ncbi:uncharacterized protein LOC120254382 [Dioscorea cayenensis subsp. rotundata]|uniref:Uncharacterized protein LOC120254382 n=1 Tax=Dioscorea cayennensis subsp. rotundata TaxID=55577 RepID=A0AB40AU33_DIOCR|nr:uncharacterized protein LOC120254382 [Dioscorea cayenensis subsp. rotundata]